MTNKKRLNKKGFTLIELIVVIAILGILAAIAIPRLSGFTERAKESSDEQFGALVGHAASALYATDQDLTSTDLTVADLVTADMLDDAQCELQSKKYGGASAPVDVSADANTAVVVAVTTEGNITVTMQSIQVYPAH